MKTSRKLAAALAVFAAGSIFAVSLPAQAAGIKLDGGNTLVSRHHDGHMSHHPEHFEPHGHSPHHPEHFGSHGHRSHHPEHFGPHGHRSHHSEHFGHHGHEPHRHHH